jgi:dienelactone hydrolase
MKQQSIKPVFYTLFLMFCVWNCVSGQKASVTKLSRQPYYRYSLPASDGDSLIFYLSENNSSQNLPLIIYVQGSGNKSLFYRDVSGRIIPQAGHIGIAEQLNNKARLLIVEKPGVQTFQQDDYNPVFDKLFSLDSWVKQIKNATEYVLNNQLAKPSRVMVIGHSEGGVVSAALARQMKPVITHTAILAGEGLSQLFSLYMLASRGQYFYQEEKDTQKRVDSIVSVWDEILKDPLSTTKKFWGFTYLRWSSMLKTSVYDELQEYNGKLFIIQGDADIHVIPENAIALYTGLKSKGLDVHFNMIRDADHSFNLVSKKQSLWNDVLANCISWFLVN